MQCSDVKEQKQVFKTPANANKWKRTHIRTWSSIDILCMDSCRTVFSASASTSNLTDDSSFSPTFDRTSRRNLDSSCGINSDNCALGLTDREGWWRGYTGIACTGCVVALGEEDKEREGKGGEREEERVERRTKKGKDKGKEGGWARNELGWDEVSIDLHQVLSVLISPCVISM